MAQEKKHLLSKHEVLSSSPHTEEKKVISPISKPSSVKWGYWCSQKDPVNSNYQISTMSGV
jgi:hypothetical protein